MARLSHAQAKATTQFTIHQDAEPEHADIPRSPQKSRRKEVPRPESNGDDGVLATELSSLRLSDHPIRKKTIKTAESSSESTVAGKKQKGRARPLGSAKKNPLLVSLSSSSESGDRYSLENVENFRPKDESWGELPSVSKDISKRSPKKAAPNPSTLLNKNDEAETEVPIGPDAADDEDDAAGTSDDGFDSLEDFIVDDDADISYCEDSDAIVEDEEEVVVKPKSPKRRLFRGVRRNAVDYPSSNSSSLSNHRTVNALGLDLADSDERFPAPFDLEPATSHTANDTTPVKKSSQSMMDGSGSSLAIQAKSPSLREGPSATARARCVTPPTSPSKPTLLSPSKFKTRIPISPHKPSVDAFWSPEIVNEWNDAHSPRKTPGLRRDLSRFEIFSDDDESDGGYESPSQRSPMISPAKSGKGSSTKRSLAAAKKTALAAKREFDEKKLSVAERFLKELDELVTGSEIHKLAAPTGGVRVVWTKTLNTTAGRANWKREIIRKKNQPSSQEEISAQFRGGSSTDVSFSASRSTSPGETTNMTPESAGEAGHTIRHHATIELAEKVIDSEDRLLSTLAHEYCHLANFMISNVRDNPHGASFKAWAAKCRKALASHPVYGPYKIDITTKHSYEINFKYLWCCTQCGHEYGRHSKSVDPKKHRCSRCDKGLLVQVRPKPRKQKNGIVSENKENRDPRDNVIDLT